MQRYLKKLQKELFHIYNSYRENVLFKAILKFASIFYFLAYKTRLLLYKFKILKSYSLPALVISIGNITSGGTGKTSVTIDIAKYLLKRGYKVAVLSRGYKRNKLGNDGNILISDGQEILCDFEISGDEPYLIAKNAPQAIVIVGKDRYKAGLTAIKLGAEVLILDDSYQHIRLNRNENILLLDSKEPFDNECLLPCGYLRELPESIKRATAIILSNYSDSNQENINLDSIRKLDPNIPVVTMKYKLKELRALNIKKIISPEEAMSLKAVAFCGIGNPQSFLNTLKENNVSVSDCLIFPDHHNYSSDDLKNLTQLAIKNKVDNIITTEKDSIKIETLCESLPLTFWTTTIETSWGVLNPFETILTNQKLK